MVKNKRIDEQKEMVKTIEAGVKDVIDVVSLSLNNLKRDIYDGKYGTDVVKIAAETDRITSDLKNSTFILQRIAERVALVMARRKNVKEEKEIENVEVKKNSK